MSVRNLKRMSGFRPARMYYARFLVRLACRTPSPNSLHRGVTGRSLLPAACIRLYLTGEQARKRRHWARPAGIRQRPAAGRVVREGCRRYAAKAAQPAFFRCFSRANDSSTWREKTYSAGR
jgi:hypothetical protein